MLVGDQGQCLPSIKVLSGSVCPDNGDYPSNQRHYSTYIHFRFPNGGISILIMECVIYCYTIKSIQNSWRCLRTNAENQKSRIDCEATQTPNRYIVSALSTAPLFWWHPFSGIRFLDVQYLRISGTRNRKARCIGFSKVGTGQFR